ncbi:hypothetical protein ABZ845_22460 [Streptomyces sp. NPDC047022]|uniref:hypothetical protein n=1 Tax=Streptomyces sp. NPDC047022 TaxID=3155737 RepID=UPI0034002233
MRLCMWLSRRIRPLPWRPWLSLAVWCVLATALLPQARAGALPGGQPECAAAHGSSFPLATSIHGGPAAYESGGASHTWFIDLKNTTTRRCGSIHPVVVLVDAEKALTAAQPKLEFFDGDRAHPVSFVHTDRAELVGVFDDGFPGFTVEPGQTVSVKVRLALSSGTRSNDVVVNAAIVQRRGNDGEWVGESNDYRFRIEGSKAADARPDADRTTPSPSAWHSPAGQALADTGPRRSDGLSGMLGTLLPVAFVVLCAGLSVLLYRRHRGQS